MRKNYAIVGAFAACLALVSCAKQFEEGMEIPAENGIRVSLAVSDEDWDATKSVYTPGQGIKITKNEKIALFYDDGTKLNGDSRGQSYCFTATPLGDGTYSFTAPEAALDKTWYSVVPYSLWQTRNKLNGAQYLMLNLPSTQYPGQNTFDPQTDFLVGKPFTIEGTGAKTATINAFKRITAPFKLELTGLAPTDKVYAVTFALSQSAKSEANGTLIGYEYYNIGANPDNFTFYAMQTTGTRQNGVSAIYDEGLVAEGGNWPVWLNVWPTEIKASCSATVTVFTADSCYIRTAPIPAGFLVSDKINKFSFNVKGAGYSSSAAISQGFFHLGSLASSKTETTLNLTATDGVARDWKIKGQKWTASVDDGGSGLPDALAFPSHVSDNDCYFDIPSVGRKITKIRIYFAPLSHNESRAYDVNLFKGDDYISTITSVTTMPGQGGCAAGGYLDIACPAGYEDMQGMSLKFGICAKNVKAVISRIALFVGDPIVDTNDYYAMFLAGKDIVIGNQTYNINDEGIAYTLLEGEPTYQNFKSAIMGNDVVFIDNSVTIKNNSTSGIVLTRPRPTAIVGRYKKDVGQPHVNMAGKFFQTNGGGMSLLNVKISTTDGDHGLMMSTSAPESPDPIPQSYNIIDCTTNSGEYLLQDRELTGAPVTSYIIDNSICVINTHTVRGCFFMTWAAKDFELSSLYRRMSITNSVFYCPLASSKNPSFRMFVFSNLSSAIVYDGGGNIVSGGAQLNNSNLDFTFSNNTIYNIAPRYVVSGGYMKSCNMSNNVIYGTYSGTSDDHMTMIRCYGVYEGTMYGTDWAHPTPANSSITNNMVEFTAPDASSSKDPDWVPAMQGGDTFTGENRFYTLSGNSYTANVTSSTMFDTINAEKFYFPVKKSVVGDKGATYDTKLWQKWE